MMYWTFVINKDFYFDLKEQDEIIWNTAKEVKKGDIILIYTGSPYSNIGFILKAISDPFEDSEIREEWDRPAIMVEKLVEIPKPIELSELRENPILSNWGAVRIGFRGSHFKMSDGEWEEIKKLILEKSPELKNKILEFEFEDLSDLELTNAEQIHYLDLNAGRAYIVRDLCYLINKNGDLTEEKLFSLLEKNVSKNDDYWNAHYLRSKQENTPLYSLNSARTLGLVEKNMLELTEKGVELLELIETEELFNYYYSSEVKKFFFKMAASIPSINTAMRILKEKGDLRFYYPKCKKTNRVSWGWSINKDGVKCGFDKHDECKLCDGDFLSHIKESSLPFETLLETEGDGLGFVFWMTSRVTPMHMTGNPPRYMGNHIYWSNSAEEELGDLIKLIDNQDNSAKKVWKIAPGDYNKRREFWPLLKEKGYIGIGNFGCKNFSTIDYSIFKSFEEVRDAYKKCTKVNHVGNNPSMIWNFVNQVKIGDWVVANNGLKGICGIGIIESDYISSQDVEPILKDDYFFHYKKVNWLIVEPLTLNENLFAQQTITKIDSDKWEKIKTAYIQKNSNYEKIFKEIENISEKDLGIKEFLNIIFKKYPHAKSRSDQVKDHILSQTFLHFAKKLEKFANNYLIYDNGKDIASANYHSGGSWYNSPYIALRNNKKDKYLISYSFRDDIKRVNLSLELTWEYMTQFTEDKLGINPEKEKRNQLIKSETLKIYHELDNLKEISEFEYPSIPSGVNRICTICTKHYEKNNLPSEKELEADLKKILEIYYDLSKINLTPEFNSFIDYLKDKNFLYTPEMLENYLLSLKVKPFVILTGKSGTGKTKIAQLFAEYLEHKNAGESVIIPVGANWTENRHLMGFFNVITSAYQSTPALDLIINASNDNSKPYFLILDEMNLSHVERYFSDFLSAMESGKEISLYSEDNAKIIKNKLIPERLEIPDNLFVIGTVNVDETTYMFSPKVLDRANTIEFKTYPARDFIMCEIEHESPEGNIDYLENPISDLKMRKCKINDLKDKLAHVKVNDNNNLWEELALEIHSFQEALSEAGFDFGFRVIDEIMRFMYAAWLYEDSQDEWKNWTRYFDAQIMQKMLPKIHGSQQELSQVLENLFELCYSKESIDKIWYSANLEEYEIKYPSSAKKLQKMGKKLQEKRFVSFTD